MNSTERPTTPGDDDSWHGASDRPIVVDTDRQLSLHVQRTPSPAFTEQLESSAFGGDGLRYRRLDVAAQLARLPDPVFLELRSADRLVATYALAQRRVLIESRDITGVYRGLLTVSADSRTAGFGRLMVDHAMRWLAHRAQQRATPLVSWGCIESGNRRSRRLLEATGSERMGRLRSLTVFRQWPAEKIQVETLHGLSTDVARALADSYADCGLRYAAGSDQPFFAVCDDSGIVAGARADLTRVHMETTGGFWDAAYSGLLRFVPAARRRYDPTNFTYLRLSDVVVRPGKERLWRALLATLLARYRAHMAMFALDPDASVYRLLDTAGLFGRFTRSTQQSIDVMVRAWGIDLTADNRSGHRPVGLAPLDI